jgi:hypothetical protein
LKLKTKIIDSRDYSLNGNGHKRLIDLLQKVNATEYISGPAGANYIQINDYEKLGIKLTFANYKNLKSYKQYGEIFDNSISVLDSIFHCGTNIFSETGITD